MVTLRHNNYKEKLFKIQPFLLLDHIIHICLYMATVSYSRSFKQVSHLDYNKKCYTYFLNFNVFSFKATVLHLCMKFFFCWLQQVLLFLVFPIYRNQYLTLPTKVLRLLQTPVNFHWGWHFLDESIQPILITCWQ